MTTPPVHKIELAQLSVKCLSDALEATGWAKGAADIVLAGQVLVDVLPPLTLPESVETAKTQALAHKADPDMCGQPVEFSLTEKQRDMCKRCLTFWCEKGSLAAGRYTTALLVKFGLGAE